MVCSKCGKELVDGSKFCDFCGSKVETAEDMFQNKKPESKQYKCPSCGSAVAFDPNSGKLRCASCNNEYDVEALEAMQGAMDEEGFDWGEYKGNAEQYDWLNDTFVYVCESCGAEIETDANTAATKCPYCGNNVTLNDRLDGGLKPNAVIPFKVMPDKLPEAVMAFAKKKKLLPKDFFTVNKIGKVQGVYVPFWLFNSTIDGQVNYRATRIRKYRSGQYDCTETMHFMLERAGNVSFTKVPVDASIKMDNDLMDSIEPFDWNELVDFESGYLAGFLADRFDSSPDAEINRAALRMQNSTSDVFRSTTLGYTTVTPMSNSLHATDTSVQYVMLPVYLLNCEYKGEKYRYAVNGQTGKVVGELPISKKKTAAWFAGMMGIGFAAVFAIACLLA